MRIESIKHGLRTNHTVRWGGYRQQGTKRNGLISGRHFLHYSTSAFENDKSLWKLDDKYLKEYPMKYQNTICEDVVDSEQSPDTMVYKPEKNYILNYKSKTHCCQMCGGRMTCKAIFHERNQYGKGVYSMGKKRCDSPMDQYYDYEDAICDAIDDEIDDSYDE
jgi:hypothetical protein